MNEEEIFFRQRSEDFVAQSFRSNFHCTIMFYCADLKIHRILYTITAVTFELYFLIVFNRSNNSRER
jgi:hypothetical protein